MPTPATIQGFKTRLNEGGKPLIPAGATTVLVAARVDGMGNANFKGRL